MRSIVVYFSVNDTNEYAARKLKYSKNADLFRLEPWRPYREADLNWKNPFSRCAREHREKTEVPPKERLINFEQYTEVYLGFPVWFVWVPNIVLSFCKEYDWSGKRVWLFSTSDVSGCETGPLLECIKNAEYIGSEDVRKYRSGPPESFYS